MSDDGHGIHNDGEKAVVPCGRSFHILVVDDDRDVATSIVRALEVLGHTAATSLTCFWSITACPR
jgi:PleD family two-component response regulator